MCRRQRAVYRNQRGLSMVTFLVVAVLVVFGAIGGMKIGPAYLEYAKVKKAVAAVALEGRTGTVADVRKGFDRRAQIDDIDVIGGADLEVSKEGGDVVVSFAYTKKIGLVGNVSLLIEFAGATNQ
ncbi:MAG: hypothetical protein A2V78_07600 [Betaproteobacteria bacterium RBG_16_64_18]|nr:MAG: hypothetical protein A2V78_07600 [Betaproteobacteria bacterium RBG_16_64_18]